MVEVLIGVVLLAIGGAGGWFARKLMEAASAAHVCRRLTRREDIGACASAQAFEALMGYNAETAYGMQKEG